MVKLSELGEFGLIDRFSRRFLQKLPAGVVGIGDDCAVIPQNEQTSLLVTTDALVENIHFLRSAIRPEDLGYKALAVNLSDIAAMGGTPSHIFLSLAIPKECEVEWLDQFFEGFYGLAQSESVTVLGGDTTQSPGPFVINVTLLGTARTEFVKFRSTAQVGDWVCVTGYLGDSSGGLRSLLEDRPADEDIRRLREAHHRPRPHLAEGKWLASQSGVHAMMDISDGIDSDLRRIMEQSNQGVRIDLEKLPRSPSLKNASALYQWNDVELAATGGEDYCLLLTIASDNAPKLFQNYLQQFKRPLFCIGEITDSAGHLVYELQGNKVELLTRGYDHFEKDPSENPTRAPKVSD